MNRFYVQTDHGRISYLKKEGNPVIIMLHGMGGMGNNFLKISGCVNGDYGFVFPDLLGHGKSDKPENITVGIQAEAIDELIRELGIEKYYIGGNSYGGWVSLYHEYMYGSSMGMILISSAGTNPTVSEYGGENEEAFIERIMKMNPANDKASIRNMLRNNGDGDFKITPGILGKIEKKSLVIWGSNDRMIPLEYGKLIHDGLRNSEMHIIEGGGHTTHVTHYEEVCSLINNFLGGK